MYLATDWLFIAMLVIGALIGFMIKPRKNKFSREHFENDVTHLLDKERYKWKKDEGVMYIVKKGIHFGIVFQDREVCDSIRVHFSYLTGDDELKLMNAWGQLVMSNELNRSFGDHTIVINDGFGSYCYADVRTPEEFLYEFNYAYNHFADVTKRYDELKPQITKDFPKDIEELGPHIEDNRQRTEDYLQN